MDKKRLSHTSWKCQYHIVFIPKYRKNDTQFREVFHMKKTITILLSLIMVFIVFAVLPVVSADAFDGVSYLDADGVGQTANGVTEITSGSTALSAGWYAVTADTEINSRITCTGDVNLILCNDATLTAHKGITVSGENSLTIYQQAEAENAETGTLIIDQADDSNAGIGGADYVNSGYITINGGTVTAKGGLMSAGIGGGEASTGEHITINGGTVRATGGYSGAGIGGGMFGAGTVTINGGNVTATGGFSGAGIGGGYCSSGKNITINGGTVRATGGQSASGIGSGQSGLKGNITLNWTKLSDSITASSYEGTVTVKRSLRAGQTVIPSGIISDNSVIANKTLVPALSYVDKDGETWYKTSDYTVITSSTTTLSTGWYVVSEDINKWSRYTVSGDVNLLLCNDTTFGAHWGITVSEGNSLTIFQEKPADGCETGKLIVNNMFMDSACIGGVEDVDKQNCGRITINGGTVTATGGNYCAGIGGGKSGSGGNITINGGIVNATGGGFAAGIGGGHDGDGGNIIINGGTVTAKGREGYSAGIGGGKNGKGGNITISGGTVTATGYAGIGCGEISDYNYTGSVTLKWTQDSKHTMSVYSSGCNVGVTLENGFKDGNDAVYAPGTYGGGTIAGKTLTPAFFDVTWKNYDGTVLETDEEVEGGTLPNYDGETPVKPADEYHSYAFSGWTPEVSAVIADTTYTAAFEPADGCFSGHSLTLDGDIGINSYVLLSDAQLTRGAVVDFAWTVEGVEKTHSVTLTAADKTANGYRATCPVAVAEMTCNVNATLTICGVQYDTDTYSVKQYADTILSDDYKTKYLAADHTEEEYNELATLVKAMLIYGAKAQIWFDRNLDDLADDGLEYTLTEVTPEMISPSARDMESGLDAYGLKYEGTTIVYLSKTSLRHYYTITDQAKFDLVKDSVMFDAEPVEYHTKDGKIYFEVSNIGAADLDTPYPLQIGTNIYSYTVLDYVRECLKAKYTPYQTMLLVVATYWYNQAANDYFG